MDTDDFVRGDVTDQADTAQGEAFTTELSCKCLRLFPYRFEVTEPVKFTSKGVRIAGILPEKDTKFVLHIYKREVIKVIAHFASSEQAQPLITLYMLKRCAQYVKTQLQLPDDAANEQFPFKANGSLHERRLLLVFDSINFSARETIKAMFNFVDEISTSDAAEIFERIADLDRKELEKSKQMPPRQLRPDEQISLLMYPPKGTGGLCIRMEDYMCLTRESYLNDIIIDFYLLWLRNTLIPERLRDRTHIFSTFFYKRLTTLTRSMDVKLTPAQRRHARVQKWTKLVDIFDKDFIIVPINEQSHWFLAIICFPCLKGPVTYDTNQPVEAQQLKRHRGKKVPMQISNTTNTSQTKRDSVTLPTMPIDICNIADDESERDEAEGDESDMASEDSESSNSPNRVTNDDVPAVKQPLILIFDSLAGASRSRVVATLRDYLTCEYKVKKPDAQKHIFSKDNMPGHCVKVPQQNNFTDCGLYLLQYVQQFFKEPIKDYRLPIKQLTNWFDYLTVTKKREDIAHLIQQLMDESNSNQRLILPVIEFPTLNGQLVEYPEESESAEFEEEEGHDDEDYVSDALDDSGNTEMEVDPTYEELQTAKAATRSSTAATVTTNTTTTSVLPETTTARRFMLKRRLQNGSAGSPSGANGADNNNGNQLEVQLISSPKAISSQSSMLKNRIAGIDVGSLKTRKIEP
ncbi:sentrin-specific protease 6-like isoform X2 [Drosophila sulfurigaster albostrigata]|uniref:sentrin-specific protease 6-like isoform X2 n=1 Tax=Drosophila sulfurigaster albostrigata TaxID=89887 RepID=UPI002D21EB7E|nr:sentrin-specific protease 6-like isoform X2 [Drosophila sulfurigaster albostrigata]